MGFGEGMKRVWRGKGGVESAGIGDRPPSRWGRGCEGSAIQCI